MVIIIGSWEVVIPDRNLWVWVKVESLNDGKRGVAQAIVHLKQIVVEEKGMMMERTTEVIAAVVVVVAIGQFF